MQSVALDSLCWKKLCAARHTCGSFGVDHTEHLQTNGLRDVGARGHGVAIAQKMSIVRDQVVENQRSVERTTARRDHTPSFFVFAESPPEAMRGPAAQGQGGSPFSLAQQG